MGKRKKELSLDEIKDISIGILLFIDSFCKSNNLKYFLAAGTLLGAIRHKGFIPWDDDIDIMMPRADYEKLVVLFPKNDRYAFVNHHSIGNTPYAYGKVVDNRTEKIEPLKRKYQCIGVDVDVFPIDNYPNDIEEAIAWCNEMKEVEDDKNKLAVSFFRGGKLVKTVLRNIVICIRSVKAFLEGISVRKRVLQLDSMAQKYNNKETDYCGIAAIAAYGIKKRNRKKIYSEGVEVLFEGHSFPAPKGYDEYLTDYYGDYMRLPPKEKRVTHHNYKAYWK